MKRVHFVNAYVRSCLRRLEANDPGSPAEMAAASVDYRNHALNLWRRLAPGVRAMTLQSFEGLLKSWDLDAETTKALAKPEETHAGQ